MTRVHALLDLTLARGSAHLETLTSRSFHRTPFALAKVERRYTHQSVSLENASPPQYPLLDQDDRSFYSRCVIPLALLSMSAFIDSWGLPLLHLPSSPPCFTPRFELLLRPVRKAEHDNTLSNTSERWQARAISPACLSLLTVRVRHAVVPGWIRIVHLRIRLVMGDEPC